MNDVVYLRTTYFHTAPMRAYPVWHRATVLRAYRYLRRLGVQPGPARYTVVDIVSACVTGNPVLPLKGGVNTVTPPTVDYPPFTALWSYLSQEVKP